MTHRRLIAAVAILLVLVAACGSNDASTATSSSAAVAPASATTARAHTAGTTANTAARTTANTVVLSPPFEPLTRVETFVDTTRPTAATQSGAEVSSRTIKTTIVYPNGPGPFPLVVLNHGLTGTPAKLSRLSASWASAGYVVVLPAFPLTNGSIADASANLHDVVNQPADVSFVIDRVLTLSDDDSSPLFGRVDEARIGVAGHSLGAATTYGVAFNRCCLDERIDAVVIMAGFVFIAYADNDYTRTLPVLIIHGDTDPVLDISLDQTVYEELAGPKWFLTLIGGSHSSGIEDGDTPYDGPVGRATTAFWNTYLSATPLSTDALHAELDASELITVQTGELTTLQNSE